MSEQNNDIIRNVLQITEITGICYVLGPLLFDYNNRVLQVFRVSVVGTLFEYQIRGCFLLGVSF